MRDEQRPMNRANSIGLPPVGLPAWADAHVVVAGRDSKSNGETADALYDLAGRLARAGEQ
jgi:hypothetical protein